MLEVIYHIKKALVLLWVQTLQWLYIYFRFKASLKYYLSCPSANGNLVPMGIYYGGGCIDEIKIYPHSDKLS